MSAPNTIDADRMRAIRRERRTEARIRTMDTSDIIAEIHALQDVNATLLAALLECDDFFDDRADAEMDNEGLQENAEMQMLVLVRAAIAKAEGRE